MDKMRKDRLARIADAEGKLRTVIDGFWACDNDFGCAEHQQDREALRLLVRLARKVQP